MTSLYHSSPKGVSPIARLSRWWKAHSPDGRRAFVKRGGLSLACFSAVAIGLPILSQVNGARQDAQQFRERNVQFAANQNGGAALRADANAPALLRHDWLRSVEYSLERNPDSALSRYGALERDRAALSSLRSLEIGTMERAEDMMAQTKCLAEAVYYESRSEKTSGQLAVAEVIMNRVKDHRYPNSICDVVYQGATRTTGCQFTFTCDGATKRQPTGVRWQASRSVAKHVVMDLNEKRVGGATHYHATYVNPVWNSGLVRTNKIGAHIFYRFPNRSEWAAASARQERRLESRRTSLSTVKPVVAAVVDISASKGAAPVEMAPSQAPEATKKPKVLRRVVRQGTYSDENPGRG